MNKNRAIASGKSSPSIKKQMPIKFTSYKHGDTFFGTFEQLMATGKFKASWFPGRGKNHPTDTFRDRVIVGGRECDGIKISRRKNSTRYCITVAISQVDRMIRHFPDEKAEVHAKSIGLASNWLRTTAKSKSEFVALQLHCLKNALVFTQLSNPRDDGFAFTDGVESLCKGSLPALLDAAMNAINDAREAILPNSGSDVAA